MIRPDRPLAAPRPSTDLLGPPRRRRLRAIVILPSAFTLANLFLGVWAIVHASRGEFETAGWLIVVAGVFDMLDGRIARFTATGSAFGEELDSLVDAISFGVAPALIVYFEFFRQQGQGEWGWILSFLYIVAAVVRLARFNIEQAGTAKAAFHGLPSPTAGSCLATFWIFTQTPFWRDNFSGLDPQKAAGWLTMAMGVLMVSNVLYPVVPRFNIRAWSGRLAFFVAILSLTAAFTYPQYFFFPFAILYITYGLLRSVLGGFDEKLPEVDPLLDEEPEADDVREMEYEEIRPRPDLRARPPTDEAEP
ncbi:MAG TPA: CDP-diacylglycerol--serine O-phosphatidyltransferase [Longimicrobiaceae bacterium]|nr:CDP-diacylglycerol--serine O-phosphatidyltransferase [Longimicrobiaceae bacterium]